MNRWPCICQHFPLSNFCAIQYVDQCMNYVDQCMYYVDQCMYYVDQCMYYVDQCMYYVDWYSVCIMLISV